MFQFVRTLEIVCLLLAPVTAVRAELPPLIPRNVLFGNPVKTHPSISPDGKHLAYLAPDNTNVLQVWVQTIGKDDARKVTADKRRGNPLYLWTYMPHTMLYSQDNNGDELYHLYSANFQSGLVRDLTPFCDVKVGIVFPPDGDFPNELLVGLNLEERSRFDIYRIDLTTGAVVLDTRNPGGIDVQYNRKSGIQAAKIPLSNGGTEIRYRLNPRSSWKTLVKWGADDAGGSVVAFTADGKSVWLVSSEGRNTLGLVKRDLASGNETLVASDTGTDVWRVLLNSMTKEIEAVAFRRERVKWRPLNMKIAEDLDNLQKGAHGDFEITSADKDGLIWLISYAADVQPTDYYIYDRLTKKLTHLFAAQPELGKYTLAPMKHVTIKSRDGLDLVSYLTLPVGVRPKGLPMVLLVHGGPWSQDIWGYNPETQWLANRGYAVLQVNYRGSSGFGKRFLSAGNRQSAGKMHDDLIDAVQWAIRQGIADPKRVAVYGSSYGGYAALVGATFTPDVFACAVSLCGPSNLVTFLKSYAAAYEFEKAHFGLVFGDVESEQAFLRSRSPLFKAEKIRIPLLIAHGANDPLVTRAEADQIVKSARNAGKDVEYLLFPDEGHGLTRPQNRMKFYAEVERFLGRHLGGRVAPMSGQ